MANRRKRRYKSRSRRRRNSSSIVIIILSALLVVAIAAIIVILFFNPFDKDKNNDKESTAETNGVSISEIASQSEEPTTETVGETESQTVETTGIVFSSDEILANAQRTAAMYDYDKAIGMLTSVADYESNKEYQDAVALFTEEKSHLVQWADNTQITHIFFHTLIADNALAFDGDYKQDDYNTVMTTISEFNKIMQAMYDKGYVMVDIHDIAKPVVQADGSVTMVKQPIYLPAGKIPFVLSQDDISYYEYMTGDGFANRLIVNPDGSVTNEMDMADGTVKTGSYDMIPLVEDFLKTHPDFSYRGARGIIALTGYNGLFGYRTSDYAYGAGNEGNKGFVSVNPNIETDKAKAKVVADALRNLGWEFATHGWGHRDMGRIELEDFIWDIDLWYSEVIPIIGPTDIVIYPKGADIGTFRDYRDYDKQVVTYPTEPQRYEHMKELGFNYFCNVDGSTPYWVQMTPDYMRMGRINVDGQALYEAVVGYRNKIKHIFSEEEIKEIFDTDRPTPVPGVPVE